MRSQLNNVLSRLIIVNKPYCTKTCPKLPWSLIQGPPSSAGLHAERRRKGRNVKFSQMSLSLNQGTFQPLHWHNPVKESMTNPTLPLQARRATGHVEKQHHEHLTPWYLTSFDVELCLRYLLLVKAGGTFHAQRRGFGLKRAMFTQFRC